MLRIIRVSVLCFAVQWVTCLSVKADFVLAMDMDLSVAGIQSTRNVAAGSNIYIGLVLMLDGGSETGGFSLGLNFDRSALSIQTVDISGRPLGFENLNSVTIDNTVGVVRHLMRFPLTRCQHRRHCWQR